jgi:hypothetical protein
MQATRLLLTAVLASAALALPASAAPESAKDQVWAAETAFARTMADRDLAAFGNYVSDEAVFFSGPNATHGKAKIVAEWTAFYTDKDARSPGRPTRSKSSTPARSR